MKIKTPRREEIFQAVCNYYGFGNDLFANTRETTQIEAKALVVYLVVKHCNRTYPANVAVWLNKPRSSISFYFRLAMKNRNRTQFQRHIQSVEAKLSWLKYKKDQK
jgi:hypothetical protein